MKADKPGQETTVIRVVRKKKGHGRHGGAWKVAYADFVTAMMAFFLVMWILGMDQDVKEQVQGYFNDPIGFSQGRISGPGPLPAIDSPAAMTPDRVMALSREHQREQFRRVAAAIGEALRSRPDLDGLIDQIEIVVTDDGLRIELVEDAQGETFFPFASANLKPPALRLLRLIAPELDQLGNGVVFEGHTDAVPFGRADYSNWDLSTERAHAARRALEAAGFEAASVLEVRGYADRHLRVPENPFDPRNRRISMLLPFRDTDRPAVEMGGRDVGDRTAAPDPVTGD